MELQASAPRWRRRILVALLVTAVLYVVLLAVEGVLAARAVEAADTSRTAVAAALADGDLPAAQRAATRLGGDTARARLLLSGPQWVVPQATPLVGDDLRAVRLSVRALDDVVHAAAIPVVEAASSIRGTDGRLDVSALARLEPVLTKAALAADAAAGQLNAIRPAGLVQPLRGPVVQAQEGVQRLSRMTASARDGLRVALAVLGVNQPSTTLLGVQNPAEARGSGGIVGAWATVSGDRGRVAITSTGVNDQLFPFRAAQGLVPPDVLATYGQDIRHVANVTMTPDFPVAAQLLRSSYQAYARATPQARPIDDRAGVVTLTPRGLGLLIGATGPVPLAGQRITVTKDSAAALFENGIYTLVPDDTQRSRLVQQVLRAVFTSLQAPETDPLRLASATAEAVASGDLRIWNPDPEVQAAAGRLGAAGALGRPDGRVARLTLVSADAAKLDFYVHESVVLDRQKGTLRVELNNRAPSTVAPYVAVQNPDPGEPATGHDLIVQLHLPPEVGLDRLERDGRRTKLATGTESGWTVVRTSVRVTREKSSILLFRLTGRVADLDQVLTQPLPNIPTVTVR